MIKICIRLKKHLMQANKIPFPKASLIDLQEVTFDYTDCYSAFVFSNEPVKLETFLRFLFNSNPGWVDFLVKIRSVLVKPFGLKTDAGSFPPAISIKKGATISIFEIIELTDDEVLMYYTDKHLDGWFSVIVRGMPGRQEIFFTTALKYHNLLGRIYFFIIKPFHKLITKNSLERFANKYKLKL